MRFWLQVLRIAVFSARRSRTPPGRTRRTTSDSESVESSQRLRVSTSGDFESAPLVISRSFGSWWSNTASQVPSALRRDPSSLREESNRRTDRAAGSPEGRSEGPLEGPPRVPGGSPGGPPTWRVPGATRSQHLHLHLRNGIGTIAGGARAGADAHSRKRAVFSPSSSIAEGSAGAGKSRSRKEMQF